MIQNRAKNVMLQKQMFYHQLNSSGTDFGFSGLRTSEFQGIISSCTVGLKVTSFWNTP